MVRRPHPAAAGSHAPGPRRQKRGNTPPGAGPRLCWPGATPTRRATAEVRFPVRLRLDNDPNDPAVRRFYVMLSESNNRMARLRAASYICLAWLDGELTMPEPVAAVVFPDEDKILSPEDIFGF